MRVLMLATYFPKPANPLMGNWALGQAQAIRRQGVDLEVVSFTAQVPSWLARTPGMRAYADCPPTWTWDGLPVHYPRWPVYPDSVTRGLQFRHPQLFLQAGWVSARGELMRHAERFRPDVVYAHHTAVNGWLAMKLNEATGLPYVVTDHDLGEVAGCRTFRHRRALFSKVCKRASLMVSVASRMERELRSLFPKVRVKTVHNGTDSMPQGLSKEQVIRSDKIVLFSCGHFYPRKQFPFLIAVFAEVAKLHPNSILRIAGDGETRPQIESAIKEHSLEGRVDLLGRLPHREVLTELASADAFVLLSQDEPFATVFSEAASAGKPILLCNDGGFCDVFENGRHGFAIAPGDLQAAASALNQILSSPADRARMGAAARELFETRLRWDHNAAAMVEIFEQAIKTRTARPLAQV